MYARGDKQPTKQKFARPPWAPTGSRITNAQAKTSIGRKPTYNNGNNSKSKNKEKKWQHMVEQ